MNVLWQPHKGPQTYALSISDCYEILYGGARGGGKTDAGIVWMLKETANPLFRGLVIRRTADDLSDWLDRARRVYTNAKFTGKPTKIEFPSGAVIRTGHLRDEQAYTKYQGHEYQRMLIEELTQIPDEESYLKLLSSCRSTIGVEPQVFCTANPGGKGHSWVKGRFVEGHQPRKAFRDKLSDRYRIFIPATIDDNPTLIDADPEYVRFLDSLPEPLRSAWRKGDWDVFAGQYFVEFHPDVHTLTDAEARGRGYGSSHNKRFIGVDWGYANPFCALWCEVTHDNKVFFYRELYGTEKHPAEWGKEIMDLSKGEDIDMTLADPSMWARNPMSWNNPATQMHTDKSIANVIEQYAPNTVPANNSRVNGWRNMAQLMHFTKEKQPNFYIIKGTCPNLIRTIPQMVRDEKNPEDIDTTLEDHSVDACRYALTHTQVPNKPVQKVPKLQRDINKLMELPNENEWRYNFGD